MKTAAVIAEKVKEGIEHEEALKFGFGAWYSTTTKVIIICCKSENHGLLQPWYLRGIPSLTAEYLLGDVFINILYLLECCDWIVGFGE